MNSFAGYLQYSLNHIPELLLSSDIKNNYQQFSNNLPDIFAHSLFGYERDLTSEAKSMDMCLSMGQDKINELFGNSLISKLAAGNIHWQQIKKFTEHWNSPALITRLIEIIILEFDAVNMRDTIPVPAVFLGIESNPASINEEVISSRLAAFMESVKIIMNGETDEKTKELLTRLGLHNISHQIFQLGVMLSRESSPVKICIKNFTAAQLLEFIPLFIPKMELKCKLMDIVNKYGLYFDNLVLVLDISGAEIKRGGIECYFYKKKQPQKEKRWKEVLTKLINDNLCSPELLDVILRFPGKHLLYSFSKNYPDYYAQGLHHLKVVTDGDNISAKAYFWCGFHWMK